MVSYLSYREGCLDLSLVGAGGYVECQSASDMGTRPRPGEEGWNVVEKDRGEAGRAPPREDGRESGGESRRRVGS